MTRVYGFYNECMFPTRREGCILLLWPFVGKRRHNIKLWKAFIAVRWKHFPSPFENQFFCNVSVFQLSTGSCNHQWEDLLLSWRSFTWPLQSRSNSTYTATNGCPRRRQLMHLACSPEIWVVQVFYVIFYGPTLATMSKVGRSYRRVSRMNSVLT